MSRLLQSQPAGSSASKPQLATTRVDARSASLVVLATLAVLYTLYFAASILLPLLLAVLLSLLLAPGKRLLSERLRLPASLAALLLILALFVLVSGVALAISVPASSWVAKAPQALQTLEQKLGFLGPMLDSARQGLQRLHGLLQGTAETGASEGPHQTVTMQPPSNIGGIGMLILEGTRAFLGQLLTVMVVLFFTLAYGDTLLRRLVEIMPTFGEKRQVVDIAVAIERNISSYLLVITVMNLVVGVANGVSMWAQGLPDPLLWGTVAFLLNYIPILGPFTGVVLFFFVGLFATSGFWSALLPAAIYLGVHVLEGETITPMLLARQFTLNPVLVIVSLFVWDGIWGVTGALLAVPLLAIGKIVCDHIPALAPLGHVLGGSKAGLKAHLSKTG